MAKIIVLGNSGSGKSTFTSSLASLTKHDYVFLDTIIFKRSWKEPEYEEMEAKVKDFFSRGNCIIDGNFINKAKFRFTEADIIYFLDLNRFTCLFSVIKRYFMFKGKRRESRSDQNDEALTFDYLNWVFSGFYKTSRKKFLEMFKNSKNQKIIIFKTRHQVKKYIKEFKSL